MHTVESKLLENERESESEFELAHTSSLCPEPMVTEHSIIFCSPVELQ